MQFHRFSKLIAIVFAASCLVGPALAQTRRSVPSPRGPLQKFVLEFGDKQVPDVIYRNAGVFLDSQASSPEFAGAVPQALFPIHAYGIDGVAYYELWLTRDGKATDGWLLLSTTDRDYPIVTFSPHGTPDSQSLMQKATAAQVSFGEGYRVVRFGLSYVTLEDADGNRLAEFGEMPATLPGELEQSSGDQGDSRERRLEQPAQPESIEGLHYHVVRDYQDLCARFPQSYLNERRSRLAEEMRLKMFLEADDGDVDTQSGSWLYYNIWNSWNQSLYTQIPRNSRYNWTDCWSGCNNNAWASVFGWWDKNLGKNLIATTATGETCPTYRNTAVRQDVVDPIQLWLRGKCNTYCGSDGGGWTYWSEGWKGLTMPANFGYGYSYWYYWCNSPGCNDTLRQILIDTIKTNARPVHVGSQSHFWVGWQLAMWSTDANNVWVYGYPGWSEDHNQDRYIYWGDVTTATEVLVW